MAQLSSTLVDNTKTRFNAASTNIFCLGPITSLHWSKYKFVRRDEEIHVDSRSDDAIPPPQVIPAYVQALQFGYACTWWATPSGGNQNPGERSTELVVIGFGTTPKPVTTVQEPYESGVCQADAGPFGKDVLRKALRNLLAKRYAEAGYTQLGDEFVGGATGTAHGFDPSPVLLRTTFMFASGVAYMRVKAFHHHYRHLTPSDADGGVYRRVLLSPSGVAATLHPFRSCDVVDINPQSQENGSWRRSSLDTHEPCSKTLGLPTVVTVSVGTKRQHHPAKSIIVIDPGESGRADCHNIDRHTKQVQAMLERAWASIPTNKHVKVIPTPNTTHPETNTSNNNAVGGKWAESESGRAVISSQHHNGSGAVSPTRRSDVSEDDVFLNTPGSRALSTQPTDATVGTSSAHGSPPRKRSRFSVTRKPRRYVVARSYSQQPLHLDEIPDQYRRKRWSSVTNLNDSPVYTFGDDGGGGSTSLGPSVNRNNSVYSESLNSVARVRTPEPRYPGTMLEMIVTAACVKTSCLPQPKEARSFLNGGFVDMRDNFIRVVCQEALSVSDPLETLRQEQDTYSSISRFKEIGRFHVDDEEFAELPVNATAKLLGRLKHVFGKLQWRHDNENGSLSVEDLLKGAQTLHHITTNPTNPTNATNPTNTTNAIIINDDDTTNPTPVSTTTTTSTTTHTNPTNHTNNNLNDNNNTNDNTTNNNNDTTTTNNNNNNNNNNNECVGVVDELPIPSILIGNQDKWISVSPNALPFWEKIGLQPYGDKRDVKYIVITPLKLRTHASTFVRELTAAYVSHDLGTHTPISDSQDDWTVTVDVGTEAKKKQEKEEGKEKEEKEEQEANNITRKYVEACETAARAVIDMDERQQKLNKSDIAHTYESPALVIYIVEPDSNNTRLVACCVERGFMTLLKRLGISNHRLRSRCVLQRVPLLLLHGGCGNPHTTMSPLDILQHVAFAVFTKSRKEIMGCGANLQQPRQLMDGEPERLHVPLFVLTPRKIESRYFEVHQGSLDKGKPPLAKKPLPIFFRPTAARILHVAYTHRRGYPWISASWTDTDGILLETTLIWDPTCDAAAKKHPRKQSLETLWNKTKGLVRSLQLPWHVVVCKLGEITCEEVKYWDDIIHTEKTKSEAALDSNSNAKSNSNSTDDGQSNIVAISITSLNDFPDFHVLYQEPPQSNGVRDPSISQAPWLSQTRSLIQGSTFAPFESDARVLATTLLVTLPSPFSMQTGGRWRQPGPRHSCSVIFALHVHLSISPTNSKNYPLDSQCPRSVVRFLAEQLDALSWLTMTMLPNGGRQSCLPHHLTLLQRLTTIAENLGGFLDREEEEEEVEDDE